MLTYKLKKTILSLLLIIVFSTQNLLVVHAGVRTNTDINTLFSDPSIWVPEVLEIQEQMLLEADIFWADSEIDRHSEIDRYNVFVPFDTFSNFNDDDLIFGLSLEVFEELPTEIQQEIVGLEILASQIFAYYEEHGYFPSEDEFFTSPTQRAMPITGQEASLIFGSLGFTVSAFSVSSMAAWIGSTIGIASAIPIVQVVALAIGATILVGGIVLAIHVAYSNRHLIADNIGFMVGSGWSVAVAQNAITQTRDLTIARTSGHQHFLAQRTWRPGGGIIIGPPVSLAAASSRIVSHGDTFSINQSLAAAVANGAITIRGPGHAMRLDPAHQTISMPLNLPHFNIFNTSTGANAGGHAFF